MAYKIEHRVWLPQVRVTFAAQLERLPSGTVYSRQADGSLRNITKLKKKKLKEVK